MKLKISQKLKNNSDLILTVALGVGILILVNFFSYNFWWRHDLTADQHYSISPATKNIIKNLPDVVNVKVYFSDNLPSQFMPLRQSLTDVLAEYHSYSKNFKVQYVDIKDGSEAETAGIPKLQFNDYRQDKIEVVNGYMGLVINYRGKSEIIETVQNFSNFEYELSSRVKKLTGDYSKIGLIGGGSPDQSQQMDLARREISKLYSVENVSADKIPDDIKTILIVAVSRKFSDDELKGLDKFLMKGNSIVVLVDGISIDQDLKISENKSNLIDWLDLYGLKVNRDLVADSSAGIAAFGRGSVGFNVVYPFWPKILNKNFDQNNPLVSSLDGVILPWASSLEVDQSKLSEGAQISYLAKSSSDSWKFEGSFQVDPGQSFVKPEKFDQYNLALILSGKIKSAYGEASSDQARIFLVGDSDFIYDNFWQGNPINLIFAQNLIDGATLDADLANIRSKKVDARSLEESSVVNKELVKYLNIFGLTVVVLIFGLIRYYLRKKTKTIEI